MTPFKVRVYERLCHLYNKKYQHISIKRLMADMSKSYWPIYRALKNLEAEGTVERKSKDGGWRPKLLASAVYIKLVDNYRLSHEFVETGLISMQMNTNDRTIRGELVILESAGLVHRKGSRSGWQPIRNITPPQDKLVDAVHTLHRKAKSHIDTNTIAKELSITPRHARRLLNHYEQQGIISRKGQRGGWIPSIARAG